MHVRTAGDCNGLEFPIQNSADVHVLTAWTDHFVKRDLDHHALPRVLRDKERPVAHLIRSREAEKVESFPEREHRTLCSTVADCDERGGCVFCHTSVWDAKVKLGENRL